jgi:hypothetical protein
MANFLLRSDWRVEEAGTVKLPVESSIRLLLFAVGDEVERSDYVSQNRLGPFWCTLKPFEVIGSGLDYLAVLHFQRQHRNCFQRGS